ncbi:hypothetical protein K7432_013908 [Basidiobolus ranarum]|uniref:Tetratricopeptide SHNi-TPR domain-containing protein n=1 Tax=Basidiobolus ranarum TaxID=34480 RepID=A0ABR2WIG9_9FUNG
MQNSLEPNPPCEESPVCSETTRSSPTTVGQEVHLVESLFFEGRKAMLLFKYKEASQKFGDASKLLAKTHGSLSPQYADALFLYGQALFGSSVQRNSVVKKVGITTENLNDSEFVLNLENELELERGVHQEDTEDFENAWHNLDLARKIYRRIDTVDAKLKLAEVVMVLGDIAMEAENCRQALSEYVESLSLKQLFLKPDDRNLADAYPLCQKHVLHILNEIHQSLTHSYILQSGFDV